MHNLFSPMNLKSQFWEGSFQEKKTEKVLKTGQQIKFLTFPSNPTFWVKIGFSRSQLTIWKKWGRVKKMTRWLCSHSGKWLHFRVIQLLRKSRKSRSFEKDLFFSKRLKKGRCKTFPWYLISSNRKQIKLYQTNSSFFWKVVVKVKGFFLLSHYPVN